MVHPAPIQLRSLVGRHLELALTFRLREAFPQSHRELGTFSKNLALLSDTLLDSDGDALMTLSS